MERWDVFKKAMLAGFCISIGAAIYLSCTSKIVGAVMFAVGLFAICVFGLNLFTGKIGYVIATRNRPGCLLIWLGNFAGCLVGSVMLRLAKPSLAKIAAGLVEAKLQQVWYETAILGIFCGVLMYIAVENYKTNSGDFARCLGIFICVPVFILCGFEHSIADMVYFMLGVNTLAEAGRGLLFLLIVSVANGVGAVAFHHLRQTAKKAEKA